MQRELIGKYDVPGPRYTSYPTVPYWESLKFKTGTWLDEVRNTFSITNEAEGISLYVHLPYCESLCTYCGCNKRITKNHSVEEPYIETVLREWDLYLDAFPQPPQIREIHLGGGTPTFFKPENLKRLVEGILNDAIVRDDAEFGFEAHPNNTTKEHLQTLYDLGFRRMSLGVQDFNLKVQKAINRVQPFDRVKRVTEQAREMGYISINFDLIYGLPFQTTEGLIDTIEKTIVLNPDRIAFYSYAHVPWKSPGQRAYSENDLPIGKEKRRLYEVGRTLLLLAGYEEIGMDHFALKTDALFWSAEENTLHRNFMGYTPHQTSLLIGLGVSAISDAWQAFAQNEKVVERYSERVRNGELPIGNGHLLSKEDLVIRQHILNLMCHYQTNWIKSKDQAPALIEGLKRMREFEKDQLVEMAPFQLKVTKKGKPFIRNICMALDAHLNRGKPESSLFSQTV